MSSSVLQLIVFMLIVFFTSNEPTFVHPSALLRVFRLSFARLYFVHFVHFIYFISLFKVSTCRIVFIL